MNFGGVVGLGGAGYDGEGKGTVGCVYLYPSFGGRYAFCPGAIAAVAMARMQVNIGAI